MRNAEITEASLPVIAWEETNGMDDPTIVSMVNRFADALLDTAVRRVLLIPPDITRSHSGAGMLTRLFYSRLNPAVHCDILPALGTHRAMTRSEQAAFFGADIPPERFIEHDWRAGTVVLGHVPAEHMSRLSGGTMREGVPVEINRHVMSGGYDHILSIGQVVPHEVAGMANYTKNMLVGCGGRDMIDASHLLSVLAVSEAPADTWIGRDHSPVRRLFDYAQEHFLHQLPLTYVLTVTTPSPTGGDTAINGLYIGGGRAAFEKAAALSQRLNITRTERPVATCVVQLPPDEFRSAWLGNKAVYRTRQALADQAKLIILAPGFERFGEDAGNDALIRRYGYAGREKLLALYATETALQQNQAALAHLMHGSADERFSIIYCTTPEYENDIRSVGYEWGSIDEYASYYAGLQKGWNRTPNGAVYYIDNPALGLWTV